MNLAIKDIKHNFGRFFITTFGVGLLLMIVMGMGGIYRGLVQEATLIIERIGADVWVVQKDTRGPFAELSRIGRDIQYRALTVPGVLSARGFISNNIQRSYKGKPLRLNLQGLDWPVDKGQWLPITAGRNLGQSRYEMVADVSGGLDVGDKLTLGKDIYTVVGLTKAMTSPSGDSMAFMTITDAANVQFDMSAESIRIERQSRVNRLLDMELGQIQPYMAERAGGYNSQIPALGTQMVSAILIQTKPGFDIGQVVKNLEGWPDVSVYTQQQQKELMLKGFVSRSKKQLGLFRILLIIISTVIMALILYTLTLDKLHDIAMLKLIGAKNSVIFGLIMQQAVLLGAIGLAVGYIIGQWLFPLFPRRVVIMDSDLYMLAAIVFVISILSSLLGIWRAMKADPSEVLS